MRDASAAAGPILCIVGARPNFMKMAPLMRAFGAREDLPRAALVHTGQHYDFDLNDRLFTDLGLAAPDFNLEVGSGSHASQTADVMKRFEPVVDQLRPSCIVVVGDVNSTLACSLVAVKKGVPVAHVEAGLRSYDRGMPEEINRVLTDQISDLLYTTERSALANLLREGIPEERVHFAGNVMIDSLLASVPRAAAPAEVLAREGLDPTLIGGDGRFALATVHRPSNVDTKADLANILSILRSVADRLPVVWPVHPRTSANIQKLGLADMLEGTRIVRLRPQGYLEMVGLMRGAALALTDSGGVQEETTALGVPCLTLRPNTERPITEEQGTNTVVGTDARAVLAAVDRVLIDGGKRGGVPDGWDGHAAERIAMHLAGWLAARRVHIEPGVPLVPPSETLLERRVA
jgi:UDP-N-acetylglucosamine 2-epimerase (non-hydrolysing)